MSLSFTKSFKDLKVSNAPKAPAAVYQGNHKMASNPARLPSPLTDIGEETATLPMAPADWHLSPRYYFFGWHITSDWLSKFGLINARRIRGHIHPMYDALIMLRRFSGYKWIEFVSALPDGLPLDVDDANCPNHDAIAIAIATRKQPYCDWIPSQIQIDYLTEIFGCPPYWFPDGIYKKHIGDYGLGEHP